MRKEGHPEEKKTTRKQGEEEEQKTMRKQGHLETCLRQFSSFPLLKHSSSYLYTLTIYVHVTCRGKQPVRSDVPLEGRFTLHLDLLGTPAPV